MRRPVVGMLIAVLAVTVLAVTVLAASGSAAGSTQVYDSPDGDYEYQKMGGGSDGDPYRCELRSLRSGAGTVFVQSALEGYPLREVVSLKGCAAETVVFPPTVRAVNDDAFESCPNLKRAVYLGDRPDRYIPPAPGIEVLRLSAAAGWGEEGVLELRTCRAGAAAVSYFVLDGRAYVHGLAGGTDVSLPEDDGEGHAFVRICDEAFREGEGGNKLRTFEMGGSVGSVGVRSFYGCRELERVSLPGTRFDVRDEAFRGCSALGAADLTGAETIGFEAFRDCHSLREISVPDTVRRLYGGAFYVCGSAEAAEVGANVSCLPERCFGYCRALSSVYLTGSVASVNDSCFINCSSLREVSLPDVATVGRSSFSGCERLESVRFGEPLTAVGAEAFKDCGALQELRFPPALEYVGGWATLHCGSLTDVYFEGDMPETGEGAFGSSVRLHVGGAGGGADRRPAAEVAALAALCSAGIGFIMCRRRMSQARRRRPTEGPCVLRGTGE